MKPETWVALYAAIIGTSAFLLNLKTWFDSGVKLKLSLGVHRVSRAARGRRAGPRLFPRRGKLSRDHVGHVEPLARAGQDAVHLR
jgi:hypothetical protein